jgi:cell division protein FtsZ
MIEVGVSGVQFIAMNTDAQSLGRCAAPVRLNLTRPGGSGLGAGGDVEVGARAAEEAIAEIDTLVAGADMVFVTAGMGGGTGTGAARVVARQARGASALTVGVVSMPFAFEGTRKRRTAEAGVDALRDVVDSLIIVPNDRLLRASSARVPVDQAFLHGDDMLRHGVQGIADLVTVAGTINLDFADVRTVMSGAGTAIMAVGEGSGTNRVAQAVDSILHSPLLDHSVVGATRVLLNVTGPADMTLADFSEISERVRVVCSPDVNMLIGQVTHYDLMPELRITLIATGMPDSDGDHVRRTPSTARVPSFLARDAYRQVAPLSVVRAAPTNDPEPSGLGQIDWSHLDDQDGNAYTPSGESREQSEDWLAPKATPARDGRVTRPPSTDLPPFLRRSRGTGR